MINYLSGKALFEMGDTISLDVRDVGYQIHVTEPTRVWCLAQSEVSLFIQTIVRENAFELYGFETKNELYFFQKLLDVSGIGPKSALGIIALASTDTLYQAILNNNLDFLTSVPGIGKKTAERMCIELRDKLKDYEGETEVYTNENDKDVIDALIALGYAPSQVYQTLAKIPPETTDTQERIKKALLLIE